MRIHKENAPDEEIVGSVFLGIADKIDPQIGVDFFVRTRRQTGRIAKAMWRIAGVVRAKKIRQDGGAEFISDSFTSPDMRPHT